MTDNSHRAWLDALFAYRKALQTRGYDGPSIAVCIRACAGKSAAEIAELADGLRLRP